MSRVYIDRTWRLLWAGTATLTLPRPHLGIQIEWGPPVIWRPRFGRIRVSDGYRNVGWKAGFLWWVIRIARPRPDTTSKEGRDGGD